MSCRFCPFYVFAEWLPICCFFVLVFWFVATVFVSPLFLAGSLFSCVILFGLLADLGFFLFFGGVYLPLCLLLVLFDPCDTVYPSVLPFCAFPVLGLDLSNGGLLGVFS